nr:Ppx/GppA phosphatase family protein [Bartonella sp. HY038]
MMTPLHEGYKKPVRGAGDDMEADKKAIVNTLNDDSSRLTTQQSSHDGVRPFKTKKRARRRQKSRNANLNGQNLQGNGVTAASSKVADTNSPITDNTNRPFASKMAQEGKTTATPNKKRRRRRSTIARANQSLQPPITHADSQDRQADKPCAKNKSNSAVLPFSAKTIENSEKDPIPERRYRKFHLKRHGGRQSNNTKNNRSFEKQVGLAGADNQTFTKLKEGLPNHTHYDKPTRNNGLYAALDLGTNNCRLLIASPTRPGYFRVIDAFSRIVRLGEGLSRHNNLSETAMNRAIEALKICANKLSQCNISHQRLIATEACRSAQNGEEFIARVKSETGLALEIVNRETEARLAVSGCGTLVEPETEAIVLFDIGGGSSEIALIDVSHRRSPRLADHIIAWTSLPVGVVTLAELFGGETVTANDFNAMKKHVTDLLANFNEREKLGALVNSQGFHLLGTSGTVTTLAGIHLKLERYDRRRIDGMWMQSNEVDRMTEKLLSWNMSERVANPCIGADRADLVLAGCAILEAIRDIWPSGRLRVADRGLREGILTELMSHSGAWRKSRFARRQNHYDKVNNK